MGKVEDKIKEDLLKTVFNDTFKIYEFIDNRFKLEDEARGELITKINALNNDLTKLLKEAKLS